MSSSARVYTLHTHTVSLGPDDKGHTRHRGGRPEEILRPARGGVTRADAFTRWWRDSVGSGVR